MSQHRSSGSRRSGLRRRDGRALDDLAQRLAGCLLARLAAEHVEDNADGDEDEQRDELRLTRTAGAGWRSPIGSASSGFPLVPNQPVPKPGHSSTIEASSAQNVVSPPQIQAPAFPNGMR